MTEAWPDERKIASLRAKLSSLDTEFAHWRAESEEGERLRKHHTQIRRVTAALDAVRLQIGTQLDEVVAAPAGADDRVADIETMILAVHRMSSPGTATRPSAQPSILPTWLPTRSASPRWCS